MLASIMASATPSSFYGRLKRLITGSKGLRGWRHQAKQPHVADAVIEADMFINRGTLVCERITSGYNTQLQPYWESTHRHHSFIRSQLRLVMPCADWVTDEGLTLHGTVPMVRQFPRVTLHGATSPYLHIDGQMVTATINLGNYASQSVPVTSTEKEGYYTLQLLIPSLDAADEDMITIRLRFHRFFVPQERGLSDDTRRLVIPAPYEVLQGRQ